MERAIHTLAASAAPTRKGMRHPHAFRLAALKHATVKDEIPTASRPPISLAAEASEAIKPRLVWGAPSSKYATTPLYSPPTENPMTQRRRIISQPAAAPIWAKLGSSAV